MPMPDALLFAVLMLVAAAYVLLVLYRYVFLIIRNRAKVSVFTRAVPPVAAVSCMS